MCIEMPSTENVNRFSRKLTPLEIYAICRSERLKANIPTSGSPMHQWVASHLCMHITNWI